MISATYRGNQICQFVADLIWRLIHGSQTTVSLSFIPRLAAPVAPSPAFLALPHDGCRLTGPTPPRPCPLAPLPPRALPPRAPAPSRPALPRLALATACIFEAPSPREHLRGVIRLVPATFTVSPLRGGERRRRLVAAVMGRAQTVVAPVEDRIRTGQKSQPRESRMSARGWRPAGGPLTAATCGVV